MGEYTSSSLRVGSAEAVITPPVGLRLLGPMDRSTGVNDELWARSIVLDDGETIVALVFLDLIGLDLPFSDQMRTEIGKRIGISTVLINCTHTHSAPFSIPWSVEGRDEYENETHEWRSWLLSMVTDVTAKAAGHLEESTVQVGRAKAQVGMNRRLATENGIEMQPNPDGSVISWVDVICFEAVNHSQKTILMSHAAHPVIIHGASTLMSADYPGFAVEAVRKHIDGNVMAVFAQGCCGNINGEPLRGGLQAAQKAGNDLAKAVIQACEKAETIPCPRIRTTAESVTLPLQELPTVDECRGLLHDQESLLKTAPDNFEEQWYARNNVLCVQQLCNRIEAGEQPDCIHFEIQGLTLGSEFCLIAMTDEVFCDYQLWIEANSLFKHTMVWAYTNGCEMYVPVDSAFSLGGIEAALCPTVGYTSALYYHNRLALKPGTEGLVKAGLRSVLDRLNIISTTS